MVWISHDLGVIGGVADDVVVLREGEAVEQAPILDVFDHPQQSYTRELLDARPLVGCGGPAPAPNDAVMLLDVHGLDVRFPVTTPVGRTTIHAVKDLSFQIRRGTTLGLVGESGSGKSTVAAALTGLVKPDAGRALLGDADVLRVRRADRKQLRRRISLVFQDPFSSFDPRAPVGAAVGEPLTVHRLVDAKGAAGRVSPNCSNLSGCPARSRRAIRTNSPAGSANGSASRGRSRSSPSS